MQIKSIKTIIIITLLLTTFISKSQPLKSRESLSHFTKCYTQGLIIKNGIVWESCGQFGESYLVNWELKTQKIIKQVKFDDKYFVEGLTEFDGRLFMLTWQSGLAFEIDIKTLETINTHKYQGEGWGLTANDKHLIMSNGSNILQFINPKTFKIENSIEVTFNGKPLHRLNELEMIDGKIYANIFQTDYIVVIDSQTGVVVDKHHLPNLLKNVFRKPGVLNGIAYDETSKKTWITGKNWPSIFEL